MVEMLSTVTPQVSHPVKLGSESGEGTVGDGAGRTVDIVQCCWGGLITGT